MPVTPTLPLPPSTPRDPEYGRGTVSSGTHVVGDPSQDRLSDIDCVVQTWTETRAIFRKRPQGSLVVASTGGNCPSVGLREPVSCLLLRHRKGRHRNGRHRRRPSFRSGCEVDPLRVPRSVSGPSFRVDSTILDNTRGTPLLPVTGRYRVEKRTGVSTRVTFLGSSKSAYPKMR